MDITKTLHELAKFPASDLPVISVYLNTQWRDQHQRERVTTFLRHHFRLARSIEMDDDRRRQSLEADLARIERWQMDLLQGNHQTSRAGIALFACQGADLWLEQPSPIPFEDEFIIANHPALRQLANLHDEFSNALVVMVDSRAARLCEVVLGGLQSETTFEAEFPGRHKQGGWAQMRYQRHVKDHMDRHHKEVAAYLTTYITANPQTHLILGGQDTIVNNFRNFLAAPVKERIIDTVQLDMQESPDAIVETAKEVIQRHEQEEEVETVNLLLNRAGQGGLAVLGIQETVAALNTGRIHKLIMHRDFQASGWSCQNCGTIGETEQTQCPLCSAPVDVVALSEEMVNGVLRADGFVELIDPHQALADYEGIGALLRYK